MPSASTDDSILNSIKKLLGIIPDVEAFDQDIIIHINSVFAILASIGIGPANGFRIQSADAVWSDFLNQCIGEGKGTDTNLYEDVKTFMYMKVKLIFDPPTSSSLLDSYNNLIKEIEYRLYTQSGGY